ncbi:MAG: DUF4292 domain-containing protein [Parabacteroides sp.]
MRRKQSYFNTAGLWICLLLLLTLGGCKSSKKVGTVVSGAAKSQQVFFQAMEEQALHYQTLTARLGVEINLPNFQVNSTRVDLKMIKDSAFQLSVQPLLGIEVFRLELSRDSIKVLDRMNKRYLAENYESLRTQTPIAFNFYNLQALFTNRLFLPGEQIVSESQYSRFRLDQSGSTALIQTKDPMGLRYTFEADGEEKLLATEITDTQGQYRLRWNYADFRMVEKQIFPQLMTVEAFKDGHAEGNIQWGFTRVRLDEPVKLDFVIPAKYTRITLEQLVRTLKNLNA